MCSHPFPSVTVRIDFRGAVVGDFVYHCHIAEHEDDGMMAIIRVKPAPVTAQGKKPIGTVETLKPVSRRIVSRGSAR